MQVEEILQYTRRILRQRIRNLAVQRICTAFRASYSSALTLMSVGALILPQYNSLIAPIRFTSLPWGDGAAFCCRPPFVLLS